MNYSTNTVNSRINYKDFTPYSVDKLAAMKLNKNVKQLKKEIGCTMEAIHISAQELYEQYSSDIVARPCLATVAKLFKNRYLISRVTPLTECVCNVFGGASAKDIMSLHSNSSHKDVYLSGGIKRIIDDDPELSKVVKTITTNSVLTIVKLDDLDDETNAANIGRVMDLIARYVPEDGRDELRVCFETMVKAKKPTVVIKTKLVDEAIQNYGNVLEGKTTPAPIGIIDRERVAAMNVGKANGNTRIGLKHKGYSEMDDSYSAKKQTNESDDDGGKA